MRDDAEVIARIDAHRARRIGEMLVTQVSAEFDVEPESVLIDLAKLDGKQLLSEYHARNAKFGTTPFDPAGDTFRLYPGGVTIWSGFPGAGKTTLLRQFVCHTLARGSSVFLASLEEHPNDVIVRLTATAAGVADPTAHQVQWFIDAYAQRFRLWGVIGIAKHLQLLAAIRECATHGIRHAIIDSLMCLDVANDDFEGQRRFANLLSATARAANVHLHLVAHPRKLVSAQQELDLNDVAGAREIGGVADNVLFIRRSADPLENAPNAERSRVAICIRKQRHGSGALTNIEGWFQRPLRQFSVEQFPMAARRYLPEDAFHSDPHWEKESA